MSWFGRSVSLLREEVEGLRGGVVEGSGGGVLPAEPDGGGGEDAGLDGLPGGFDGAAGAAAFGPGFGLGLAFALARRGGRGRFGVHDVRC